MSDETYRKAILHFLWYIAGTLAAGSGALVVGVVELSQAQTLVLGIVVSAVSILAVIVVENRLVR